MKIKAGPIVLFFVVYIWAYAIFNAVNAKADEPELKGMEICLKEV
jgi:hypothetical protein